MTEILRTEFKKELDRIQSADIVIGIPSYNNEDTIEHVVNAAAIGMAKYFPNLKAVLINSDGGSKDKTRQVVTGYKMKPIDPDLNFCNKPKNNMEILSTEYIGPPGKGSAFRTIFIATNKLKARCLVVVDSDLRSITPHWFENLAKPILEEGEDYVTPYYTRDKFDGTITNSISYGLTRALYGYDIRQPIGGDFGVSGRLNELYVISKDWDKIKTVSEYGIDIWMTTLAAANKFNVCQAFLGAKVHDVKDPGESLGPMFRQVVGTLFCLMKQYQEDWNGIREVKSVKKYGFIIDVSPESLAVNSQNMLNKLKNGWKDYRQLWKDVLRPETFNALKKECEKDTPHITPELWVDLVFDYAVSFNFTKYSKDENFIETMIPLYLGRTGAFVLEAEGKSQPEAEVLFQQLCKIYEKKKPQLVELWNKALAAV
ncbi:MAG: glycosyl transferase family 2 [Cyanobacteriota bacterium]